jgi:hypothetical protein
MVRSALLAALFWAVQSGPAWMKLDQARAASAMTGKPVFIYVAVDPKTGEFT